MSDTTAEDLFTYLARSTDPQSSHDAAASTDLIRSERLVLQALHAIQPATDDAVGIFIREHGEHISDTRCRTARKRLQLLGRVERASDRGGITSSGRRADTWRVVV